MKTKENFTIKCIDTLIQLLWITILKTLEFLLYKDVLGTQKLFVEFQHNHGETKLTHWILSSELVFNNF